MYLTMPSFRPTPLSEFNKNQLLLSLTFPTLFPSGEAEFLTPRIRSVNYAPYIEYLIKYKDGWFARHPRFRYIAFNTLIRSQIRTRSSYYVQKNPRRPANRTVDPEDLDDIEEVEYAQNLDLDIELEDLLMAFVDIDSPEVQLLLKSIFRFASSLRGTRLFWNGKRYELQNYICYLKRPGLFLIFSAADYYWDFLYKYMPKYEEWRIATAVARIRLARDNLRDNPYIAAFHYYRRFNVFMNKVLIPKFKMDDWWNRYEWQSRGSTHNHGFAWLEIGPLEELLTELVREVFVRFWGIYITVVYLDPERRPDEIPPMSLFLHQQVNTNDYLTACLNRFQIHTCSTSYCLRKRKDSEAQVCRFYFSKELQPEATVDRSQNLKYYMFAPKRDHPRLNAYNELVTLG